MANLTCISLFMSFSPFAHCELCVIFPKTLLSLEINYIQNCLLNVVY